MIIEKQRNRNKTWKLYRDITIIKFQCSIFLTKELLDCKSSWLAQKKQAKNPTKNLKNLKKKKNRTLRLKSFYNFLKKKLFYISRNENFKNNFYISWWNVCGVKNKSKQKKQLWKNFLYFRKWNFLFQEQKLLFFLIFQEGTCKPAWQTKIKSFLNFSKKRSFAFQDNCWLFLIIVCCHYN